MSTFDDVIDEKIAWFWNLDVPQGTKRDLRLGEPQKPAIANRVKVIVGVRRCGKTWRMYEEIARLLAGGVERPRMLYFNFDDERLRPYDPLLPSRVMERFYRLNPSAREGAYLFFDEIQDVPNWGVFMRRLVDTEKVTCCVTGSSSRMLSLDVATEFRGRSTSYELTPFSFREYARHHGLVTEGEPFGEQDRLNLMSALDAYLRCGGYPEAQGLDDMERIDLLQGIVQQTVASDVIDRYNLAESRAVRTITARCVAQSARKVSLTKQHNQMRSQGFALSWERLAAIVTYLEDSNLIHRIPEYSTSMRENSRKAAKLYANDQSLMVALSPSTSIDTGLALETAVYLELRRRQTTARKNQVMSWSVPHGSTRLEVDFVKGDSLFDDARDLVQVSASIDDQTTRRRELRALKVAMGQAGVDASTIVTLSEDGEVATTTGTVRIVPAWRWLLEG